MNWTQIRPVIKTLIGNLSGLTTIWEDEPRPYGLSPGNIPAFCTLSILSSSGQGSDECRRDQDLTRPQGEELGDVWMGNRDVTLTIKVESEIQTDDGNANHYLELIRDRLTFKSSRAVLRAVNVAIIEILPTSDLGTVRDERVRSIAALDVFLSVRNLTEDPARYGYIQTVEITGNLQS